MLKIKKVKLKAEVAQAGSNFSVDRSNVWLLRVLARKPEILIFDDSFSALDYKTDRKLRQELAEKTQDMTKFDCCPTYLYYYGCGPNLGT